MSGVIPDTLAILRYLVNFGHLFTIPMRKSYLILSIPLLILAACSFNPKVVPIGDDYLQGNWEELFSAENDQLISYERYAFKITCDSFYLKIDSYSKVNLEGGECYNDNKWKEYVKGTYHVKDDSLYLKGAFVNDDYRYKPESSCYRFGVYEENFRITKLGTDSILINNSLSHLEHLLVLKERTKCKYVQ